MQATATRAIDLAGLARCIGLAGLVSLAGCEAIIGYEPFDPAASPPSCEDGWSLRTDVTIANDGDELTDLQLAIPLDLAAMEARGDVAADAADLRVWQPGHGAPLPFVVEHDAVWIRAPRVPAGTSTLSLYHGNPGASPLPAAPVFVVDGLDNPSFETQGGWTVDPPPGRAGFAFGDRAWVTDGSGSLLADLQETTPRTSDSTSAVWQAIELPPGTYLLRFDLFIHAASNGAPPGQGSNGSFAITVGGNDAFPVWHLGGDRGNITGPYLGAETFPLAGGSTSLRFEAHVAPGDTTGYAKASLDHLRLRRFASPAPVATVGATISTCAP